jgi:hypothetical protein
MKSENAKEYITHATCTAQEYAERFGGRELVVSRWDVSTAIELAEQDAEERMREKAIEAFKSSCVYKDGCGGAGRACDLALCEDLRLFIQKLNEE